MIASVTDTILGLHGWAALAVVFLLPALESSAFIGFIFPGEIAVLLGGVLAYQGRISLPAALVAAITGAIVGDTIGYEVGKRWGRRLLHGTIGRIIKHEHIDRAERYLAERGGKAVFLGRFTAALRVFIPGLAGMSGMEYRTFLTYNAAGGTVWAAGFVLAGYAAGSSWRRVEHTAGRASLVLLLLLVVTAAVVLAARWVDRNQARVTAFVSSWMDRPRVARLRARYERQLGFLRRRVHPREELGLWLTVAVASIVVGGWLIGILVQDVLAGDDAVHLDGPVLDWFVHHRSPRLTTAMHVVTALGSTAVLVPVGLVVGGLWWYRRRTVRPLALLAGAYLGADLLFRVIKLLTDRARPPVSLATDHFGGLAFPSGHATQATAVFGMLAVLFAGAAPTWRTKVIVWAAAVLIAVIVGISRLYLGAHWLTDVLGGWALGATWLAVVLGVARSAAALRAAQTDPVETTSLPT